MQKGVRKLYDRHKQDGNEPSGFSQTLSFVVGLYQYVRPSGFLCSVWSKERLTRRRVRCEGRTYPVHDRARWWWLGEREATHWACRSPARLKTGFLFVFEIPRFAVNHENDEKLWCKLPSERGLRLSGYSAHALRPRATITTLTSVLDPE